LKIKKIKKDIKITNIFSGSNGQSTVEFILLLPFLIITCIAVFQAGYAMYLQNNIKQLSREAARIIATTNSNTIAMKIIKDNSGLYRGLDFEATISPDLETQRKVGDIATVKIRAGYDGIGGIIRKISGKSIIIYSESSMRMECG
jgi:hypothetical protein